MEYTISVRDLIRITGLSRTSIWRRMQNADSDYCSKNGAPPCKFYRLADVITALRWASKNPSTLTEGENNLILLDAHTRTMKEKNND